MIPDLLTPCEGYNCEEIGPIRCGGCGKTYCDRHIDDHICVLDKRDE